MKLSPDARAFAEAHAKKEYPRESCGLLVDGSYLPCFNVAADPQRDFQIASVLWAKLRGEGRSIDAVIHSHPDGPIYPSERDMQGQLDTGVPWVIIPLDAEGRCGEPTIWGDATAPLLGRSFVHGVTDCYTLIEDVFALGREALSKQSIAWPLAPAKLKSFPRADSWWMPREGQDSGDDLYAKGFGQTGFHQIARTEARAGDVFLCKINSKQMNHGGVLLEGGLILHHLPLRLSRREPAGIWGRAAEIWVRHESSTDAA